MVDVKVALVDGSYHEVDSSEMAFKIAASMGFKEGCKKAKPVLLEPIMKMEIITPEDYLGDVLGDFNSRRGGWKEWNPVREPRRSTGMCPWPKCLDTPQYCVQSPKAGRFTL